MGSENERSFSSTSSLVALAMTAVLVTLGVYVLEREGNLGWDDADYLARGLRLARLVRSEGAGALGLILKERPKPPWMIGWVELTSLALGPGQFRAILVCATVVPYGMLVLAAWSLGHRFGGEKGAALTSFAVVASPMGLLFGTKVMVETFMALWLLGSSFALARLLTRPTHLRAAFLGLTWGLAALTKFTVVLFLAGPAAYALAHVWKHRKEVGPRLRTMTLCLALVGSALVVAGPWYAKNFAATVKFALFSAQFDRARTGGATVERPARWTRPIDQATQLAGWPVLLVVPCVLLGRRGVKKTEPVDERDLEFTHFSRMTLLSLAIGAVVLLVPSYHDVRFLLPIWPSLAIVLAMGWCRAARRVEPKVGGALIASAATAMSVVVACNLVSLWGQPKTTTHWAASAILEDLAQRHHVKRMGNIGNGMNWNICKINLMDEVRSNRGERLVHHDLSKLEAGAFARFAKQLDAIIVLDRSAIDPDYLRAAPAMNRGYAAIETLSGAEWWEEELPRVGGSPPLRAFMRRRDLARRD